MKERMELIIENHDYESVCLFSRYVYCSLISHQTLFSLNLVPAVTVLHTVLKIFRKYAVDNEPQKYILYNSEVYADVTFCSYSKPVNTTS